MNNDPDKNKVILEMIRELIEEEASAIKKHLEKQDSDAERSQWTHICVGVIIALIVAGISLLAGTLSDDGRKGFAVSLIVPIIILVIVFIGLVMSSKVGKRSKEKAIAVAQKDIMNTKSDERQRMSWKFIAVQIWFAVFLALFVAALSLLTGALSREDRISFAVPLMIGSLVCLVVAIVVGRKR